MSGFFVTASNIFGGIAWLSAKESARARVLRFRKGETFTVRAGDGTDYTCRVTCAGGREAEAELIRTAPMRREPSVYTAIYTPFSKTDRLAMLVRQAAGLGASEFVLFPSERSDLKPGVPAALLKTNHLCKIAGEEAKRSGRGKLPLVTAAHSFENAVIRASQAELALLLYEDGRKMSVREALQAFPHARTVSILTGPEGGLTPEEAAFAVSNGMKCVSPGPLRGGTAALYVLSVVLDEANGL